MQLPQSLQHFPHPTLIVAADAVHANIFLASGETLETVAAMEHPRELRSDSETSFVNVDSGMVHGLDSDRSDEPRLLQFMNELGAKIRELVDAHGVGTIHLVIPAHEATVLVAHLQTDMASKIGKKLDLDLMKEDPLTIVERVLGA